jgi:polyhydroxyalkanoate synthase subunit PhaC
VNNYLLGNQPPAFDILYWNADTTRLPARLHGDYLDLYYTNPFVNSPKLTLNKKAVDISSVKADSYVIAGVTDHITPWKGVYKTAQLMGEGTTFVLSNSGHLQSLLNPPTNQKGIICDRTRQSGWAGCVSCRGGKKEGELVARLAGLVAGALR